MDFIDDQPRFELGSIIEQTPFESITAQSFFARWCQINDSIIPQMVDRKTWEQRGMKGMLEKRPDGKQTLYLPTDLHMWEMIGVMETVDHDTFAKKPERRNEKKDELIALAKLFQNTGIYISSRLEAIQQGREIARLLASELYDYGVSLESGIAPEELSLTETLQNLPMTAEEVAEVDRFLAGEDVYAARLARANKSGVNGELEKESAVEAERLKSLAQFFRVTQKAFDLQQIDIQTGESSEKPWEAQKPIHTSFLAKIQGSIAKEMEAPKRELYSAVFRRGMEKLIAEMKERGFRQSINSFFEMMGVPLQLEQRILADKLHITQLHTQLETLRQTGDVDRICKFEQEILSRIQKEVAHFKYKSDASNPTEMVATGFINCVGASLLGGGLMNEVGLRYLAVDVPEHSLLLFVTEDKRIELWDMLNNSRLELTNETIVGNATDGTQLTVAHIIAFNQNPEAHSLMFDIHDPRYLKVFPWIGNGKRQYISVSKPENGLQIHVLIHVAETLHKLGRYEDGIEAYKLAIDIDPSYSYVLNNIGTNLSDIGRDAEAIDAFQRAIRINPNNANLYLGLGVSFTKLGDDEKAVLAYQNGISVDSNDFELYSNLGLSLCKLGRFEEAVDAYRKSIAINYNDSLTYNNLGCAFLDLHQNQEAFNAFSRAIALDPTNANAYFGLGSARLRLKHNEDALDAYRKYIDIADAVKDADSIQIAQRTIEELSELD